jgi:hypothetical protein
MRYSSARKLSAAEVRAIRSLRKDGVSRRWLAQNFKISLNALHNILSNSTYKDVR